MSSTVGENQFIQQPIRSHLTGCLAVLLMVCGSPVHAQSTAASSDEKVSVEGSFDSGVHRKDIRATPGAALRHTSFDVHARSYYLDRDQFSSDASTAWALGGWAGLKTGYFRDRLALGATVYTSQKLYGPGDRDGTGLLAAGQESYSVLGEAYGQALIVDDVTANLGLQRVETPYINSNDSRMTPNTFEAYTVQGRLGGSKDEPEWRFGAGYIDEIKARNSERFVSMAAAADAPVGVAEGVWVAGVNYRAGGFSIGAIDYFSDDIINMFYTEATYFRPLNDGLDLRLAAQYSDQRSTGDELLTGAEFSTDQFGVRAEVVFGGAALTAAYTSTGSAADLRNPWSSYPGYTSAQIENFKRAGEDAWMLRAAYGFPGLPGLSVYGLWVNGSDPDDPARFARDEYDLNAEYAVSDGPLAGLKLRLRYAKVEQNGGGDPNSDEFRVILYFDPLAL